MNIHEHQAKELLRQFGAPVPRGQVAFTPEEAVREVWITMGAWLESAREHGDPVPKPRYWPAIYVGWHAA